MWLQLVAFILVVVDSKKTKRQTKVHHHHYIERKISSYDLPPDPILGREFRDVKSVDAVVGVIEAAHSYIEDDNYNNGLNDDILTLYETFHDEDNLWNDDSLWEEIQTFTLENNDAVIQKCSNLDDHERGSQAFCLCQINGHFIKLQCSKVSLASNAAQEIEENQNYYYEYDNEFEENPSDEQWLGKFDAEPTAKEYGKNWYRDPASEHHLFNQGLQNIIDRIENKLGYTDKEYYKEWKLKLTTELAKGLFKKKLNKYAIDGRIKKLKGDDADVSDTNNIEEATESILETESSFNFGEFINEFRPTVKAFLPVKGKPPKEGYGYLMWDRNKVKYGQVLKNHIYPHIDKMIELGTTNAEKLAVPKSALAKGIKVLLGPFDGINIKGLARWGKGGVHEGHGEDYVYEGKGYSISCPPYMDCPIARFIFENQGRQKKWKPAKPQNVDLKTGKILNEYNYFRWLEMKEIDRYIVQKLTALPDDLERLMKAKGK